MTDSAPKNWIRTVEPRPGLEWSEAVFAGTAYDPHRHPTFAFGVTTRGVQQFDYRGATHYALPSEIFVLNPDEKHDGRAGDGTGYGYIAVHLAPELVSDALGGGPLPGVRETLSRDPRISSMFARLPDPCDGEDELYQTGMLTALADALAVLSGRKLPSFSQTDVLVAAICTYLNERLEEPVTVAELEATFGIDRYKLTRRFRRVTGMGPHRYLVMRRLGRAKMLLRDGSGLADVAAAAGFSDQSHLTKQFRRCFGLTPGAWRTLIDAGAG